MFRMGVRCTDCHDAHGSNRHKEGNDLCLQCHRAATYNKSLHHFHKESVDGKASPGWLCQNCHMPQRVYMGVDWRADHSLRIPRPDLSLSLGVPNACTNVACHAEKGDRWAADAYAKWYGQARPAHYGTIIAAARAGTPAVRADLLRLTQDRLYPAIVRATAVSLLDRYPGDSQEAVEGAETRVRVPGGGGPCRPAAVRPACPSSPPLEDPVRAWHLLLARWRRRWHFGDRSRPPRSGALAESKPR
jgi:predicted CXXCH cytochrome family protein